MKHFTWLALLWIASCAAPGDKPAKVVDPSRADAGRPAARELPWTEAFRAEAFLVADDIEVIGPAGIRDHAVLQQNEKGVYSVRTTTQGLVQELRATSATAELRGHLDNWILVASRSLRFIEVPEETPVRVRAVGQALFRSMDGEPPRRAPALEFFGARPR